MTNKTDKTDKTELICLGDLERARALMTQGTYLTPVGSRFQGPYDTYNERFIDVEIDGRRRQVLMTCGEAVFADPRTVNAQRDRRPDRVRQGRHRV